MIVRAKIVVTLFIALLLTGCIQEKTVVSQYDYDTIITVDSNYTFTTPGIGEIYLESKRRFGVTTSSGAFDFTTCKVDAKCVELIDFTLKNYDPSPITIVVKWRGL